MLVLLIAQRYFAIEYSELSDLKLIRPAGVLESHSFKSPVLFNIRSHEDDKRNSVVMDQFHQSVSFRFNILLVTRNQHIDHSFLLLFMVVYNHKLLLSHIFPHFIVREYLMIWVIVNTYIKALTLGRQATVSVTMQVPSAMMSGIPRLERIVAHDDLNSVDPHFLVVSDIFDVR
ncbi:hypothetical protein QE327_gp079 [Pseudomonas phage Henu5]|uniref:Uncharacterized protein n=1 Tax=Pseudomonas phage Henu5 TaxID=2499902 RepID=A0A410T8F0_9CAUD|nr:hypothetical protein QE327_gp079 [Pseudomonas phage Henu5]QAU05112.1 hypothetical protein Henu5_gp83 [Pseudomonas phage Henu5]